MNFGDRRIRLTLAILPLVACASDKKRPALPEVQYELDSPVASAAPSAAPVASSAPVLPAQPPAAPPPKECDDVAMAETLGHLGNNLGDELVKSNYNGNVLVSPVSVAYALDLAGLGAKGDTLATLERVAFAENCGVVQLAKRLADFQHALLTTTADKALPGFAGGNSVFQVANGVWGDRGVTIQPEYGSLVKELLSAEVMRVPFAQTPEDARRTINSWVGDHTQQKILELLPSGAVNKSTKLVLTNALYFKGAWEHPFSAGQTSIQPFFFSDGRKVGVSTMTETETVLYVEKPDGQQVVELPYKGISLVMRIHLPPKDVPFADFKTATDVGPSGTLEHVAVKLSLPKFKFGQRYALSGPLKTMGLAALFSEGADFSGITGGKDFVIGEVFHGTFIDVDERGTEAGAATGVVMRATAAVRPKEMKVNRPFVVSIVDRKTSAVIFTGRVADPTKR